MHTKAKSQKARNLARDPRVTCLVEVGQRYEELRGVELVGKAVPVRDAGPLFTVGFGVSVFDRCVVPCTEQARRTVEAVLRKRVALVIDVERTVSWDHRKLGDASPVKSPAPLNEATARLQGRATWCGAGRAL